ATCAVCAPVALSRGRRRARVPGLLGSDDPCPSERPRRGPPASDEEDPMDSAPPHGPGLQARRAVGAVTIAALLGLGALAGPAAGQPAPADPCPAAVPV